MSRFAERTYVTVEESRAELDALLQKHGASSRMIGVDDEQNRAVVAFALGGAKFRLNIPLPEDPHKQRTASGKPNSWKNEQASRTRWRLVLLLVKAKLEAIRLGLSTAPREFMADLVTDDGRTLEEVLAGGGMPQLLLAAGPPLPSNGKPPKAKEKSR
jgi:hypothetical protein